MEVYDMLRRANPELRNLCGVHRSTWHRWMTGRGRVPSAVVALLRIVIAGELPQGGEPWVGWRLVGGQLYDPAGIAHTPGTILAWHWIRQELQDLRARENRALPDELPVNVRSLPAARRAHALTGELHRRLK